MKQFEITSLTSDDETNLSSTVSLYKTWTEPLGLRSKANEQNALNLSSC